jgi:acyl dehydratase
MENDEIDTNLIGTASDAWTVEVERGQIARFARAIGDDNPLWMDAAQARAQGFPDVVAPPTFPVSFVMPWDAPWWKGLDRSRFLAGEQSFDYVRTIHPGDVLTLRMTLQDVQRKEGRSGVMDLMIQDVTGTDPEGARVFTHRRITVYRAANSTLRGS